MKIRTIITMTVLILALTTISTTTAAVTSCDCGDICVNETGWWRDGGAFTSNTTPIEAAVDNAGSGETICVKSGSYTENVDITTPHLTIRGEGAGMVTVTAAEPDNHVFEVTADYVNISGFTVTGATINPNVAFFYLAGIYLNGADNCVISDSAATNNDQGIHLYYSSNNTLTRNNCSNNGAGIKLNISSNKNTLTSNNVSNNYYGIDLFNSSNNTLASNNASNNYRGINLYSSSDNTLASNNVSNNNYGINLYSSSNNNTLANNNVSNNDFGGIGLGFSSNNTLAGNNASNNDFSINLYSSSNNTLTSNNASNNFDGIHLSNSSNNTLASNNVSNNYRGIYLYSSSNNKLESNNALNNDYGIRMRVSSNNTLESNTMSENMYNFNVSGFSLSRYTHNIDTSNTVDGKPIYYWVDQKDRQIPSDAGFVGVVNGTNITVRDLTLTNNGEGVLFVYTDNSRIENVTTSNNDHGIILDSSSNNTLANNNASNNDGGIYLWYSSNNNTLENNTANLNNKRGIYLLNSRNNTLTSNTANSNNYCGIRLDSSSNNTLTSNTANSNNYYGIRLDSLSNNNTLENNTASSNKYDGINLRVSSNNTLENNTASSNKYDGIILGSSSNNTLENNTASSNKYNGIYLWYSSNNTLTENTANSNGNYGIYLWDSSDNLICNNNFNNKNNAYDDGSNQWNTTKTNGTNIIGGPFLGGNYWSDYAGVDNDDDGLGDTLTPYNCGDYHPLVMPDNTPPSGITYLENITHARTYINWTWTDPLDSDFSKVMVYLDGALQENVNSGVECYNATSLTPGTTYEIGTRTVDTTGNINQTWVNHTATTASTSDTTAPVINNVTNTDLTTDSVTISWITDENSDSVVRYGTTSGNYTNEESGSALVTLHNIPLSGLNEETTYYYMVYSTDASGNAGEGSEYNFTTTTILDTTAPVISNVTNTDLTTDSVTISWITDEKSDSVIRYGTTPSNYTNEESGSALVTIHNIPLSGLSEETTYYYMVYSTDASGNTGEGSEYNFTTSVISGNTTILISDAIAAPNCYAFTSIIVDNVTNLGSGSITVTYNSSVVHVTNITSGDGNALVIQDWNVDNTAGSVTIAAWDADESHNGDVVFAIVNFHAVGEYMDSTPLTISSPELIDYTSYGIIGHIVTNGTFSIVDKPPMIMDAIATPDMILNDNGRPRVPGTNVTVLNATVNGGSGVANVTIDLSSIGGPDDQVMERIAGTDVWTVATNATEGINLTHELVVTASDRANNSNTSVIELAVLMRGDVVRDGNLNSADALYIAKYLVGREDMLSLLVGDISPAEGDGRITSADALYLAKYLVGKEVAP